MKALDAKTKGMFLKMIETVWGNLRTREARAAWAKGQAKRNETGDQIFRHWLVSVCVPEDVAKKAWEHGSRKAAIGFLADNADWIKYYRLEKEVRAAFKAHEPK